MYRIFDQRLMLMLEQDDPAFPNWDQDATAVADRYQDQDPGVVAGQLAEAGDRIASRFAGLTDPRNGSAPAPAATARASASTASPGT